ncbi:hypothetical protein LZC95_19525 [Pendulispora brunnea]|uniref:Uncharacterized protein n=1 Tax=Pendulispora brunnea TaxID=2905690 RepID=A0ABZ2KK04_9BACT
MANKTASSTRQDANNVAGMDAFIDLGRIPEVILNNGEAAVRIWGRNDIAVMVYDMGAVSGDLREPLTEMGWDGTTRVFGVDRARARAALGAVHDMQAAWADRQRDGVAQIIVATSRGPVLVNFEPEGEGFSIDPATLRPESGAPENVRINARSNGTA